MKTNKYAGIHPLIVAVIARQSRKLVGRYGIVAADVHDIEQDLHRKVWSSLPGLSTTVFAAAINQIVNHEIIDLIRKRERDCRDWRQVAFSLDDAVPDTEDENECVSDVMDLAKSLDAGFGLPASWHERREMAMDLDDALLSLPRELRDLAETLDACGGNLSEAARDLGISRKMARLRLARLQQAMAWLRDA
jgi:DNA-directed RNA polymerase specialized sigma24 family protein